MSRVPKHLCVTAALCALTCCAAAAAQGPGARRNVAFVVWEGIELIEFTGPAQVFEFAGYRGFTVAEKPVPLRSYFVTITPEFTFENCPKPDIVVIPAGVQQMGTAALNGWLKSVVPNAEAVLTVCNGSLILANTGLLNGHQATSPTGNSDDLMILGRDVRHVNRRVAESGKFVTTDSYFAGVDGALYLVAKLSGAAAAERAARANLYDWRPAEFADAGKPAGEPQRSRRREVFDVVTRDGVQAAVDHYRKLVESHDPAYGPPLSAPDEERRFRWLAWNLQNARRYEESLKLCQFSAAAFPDSNMARACVGEALVKAGRPADGLQQLLEAATNEPGQAHALRWMRMALASRAYSGGPEAARARELLRDQANAARAVVPPEDEPGEALIVSGVVRDRDGKPVRDAIVYLYHTDARGLYSRDGMDEANPRLFVYLKTGADGTYEVRTIRPAHYPEQREKIDQHIHYEVTAPGFRKKNWRLGFADDPHWKGKTAPGWVSTVSRGPDGVNRCTCDIVLDR